MWETSGGSSYLLVAEAQSHYTLANKVEADIHKKQDEPKIVKTLVLLCSRLFDMQRQFVCNITLEVFIYLELCLVS